MPLKLITAPAVHPVSLAAVKAHLRVDHDDEDDLIEALIHAARQHLEGDKGWLGRALVAQTWDLYLDEFPSDEIRIPLPPLQSVTYIKYYDADGVEQTVDAADYTVDNVSQPGWVVLNSGSSWPSTQSGINKVRVRFVAGYPADETESPADLAGNVPSPIKAGLLLTIGTLYANRETIVIGQTAVELPWAAEALLNRYRIYSH